MSNRRHTSTTQSGLPPKLVACGKFYNTIEDSGVNIKHWETTEEGGIALEYIDETPDVEGAAKQVREIAGAFCGADENGVLGDLEATVYDPHTENVATWCVKSEWVAKLKAGEWDEKTILVAVEDSLEVESQ